MEAVKGFIFDRGPKEMAGVDCHSYLISMVLVTDEPLEGLAENETIFMDGNNVNLLTPALQILKRYKVPHKTLGEAGNAILQVSNMSPADLEPVEKPMKKKKGKK